MSVFISTSISHGVFRFISSPQAGALGQIEITREKIVVDSLFAMFWKCRVFDREVFVPDLSVLFRPAYRLMDDVQDHTGKRRAFIFE